MNDMEKAMRALQTYMEQHADEITDEKSQQAVIDRFMQEYNSSLPQRKKAAPESAEDYLELAQSASSEKKSLEYLKKAAELDPNNLDVQVQVIFATQMKKPHEVKAWRSELVTAKQSRFWILSGNSALLTASVRPSGKSERAWDFSPPPRSPAI